MSENSADFETLYSSYSIDASVSTHYVTWLTPSLSMCVATLDLRHSQAQGEHNLVLNKLRTWNHPLTHKIFIAQVISNVVKVILIMPIYG